MRFSLKFLTFPSHELWPQWFIFELRPAVGVPSWVPISYACVFDPLCLCLILLLISFSSSWSSCSFLFPKSLVHCYLKLLVLLFDQLLSFWSFYSLFVMFSQSSFLFDSKVPSPFAYYSFFYPSPLDCLIVKLPILLLVAFWNM